MQDIKFPWLLVTSCLWLTLSPTKKSYFLETQRTTKISFKISPLKKACEISLLCSVINPSSLYFRALALFRAFLLLTRWLERDAPFDCYVWVGLFHRTPTLIFLTIIHECYVSWKQGFWEWIWDFVCRKLMEP